MSEKSRIIKILCLCGLLTLGNLQGSELLNLWSGREIVLPESGRWEISAGHGRHLASGAGAVRFALPPLPDGTSLNAVLTIDGKKKNLRFHSPKPLSGKFYSPDVPSPAWKKLETLGMRRGSRSAAVLHFTQKHDFPQTIGKEWDVLTGFRAENPGTLSVFYNKTAGILDTGGEFTYIILQNGGQKKIIFTPDFDLDNIDNVLLIKNFMEDKK